MSFIGSLAPSERFGSLASTAEAGFAAMPATELLGRTAHPERKTRSFNRVFTNDQGLQIVLFFDASLRRLSAQPCALEHAQVGFHKPKAGRIVPTTSSKWRRRQLYRLNGLTRFGRVPQRNLRKMEPMPQTTSQLYSECTGASNTLTGLIMSGVAQPSQGQVRKKDF